MIRRNSVISTIVAAATVISMMPVTGVYASETIKSQDGQLYNAVAYKDGKFYIAGEVKNKDEAPYYLADGSYKKLSDIDTEDKVNTFGTKYLEVDDGEYYLDLATGKVSDSKVKDEELDSASVSLRSKVKNDNDGRYDNDDVKEVKDLAQLPKAKFQDGWYAAKYKAKEASANVNGGAETFNVYANKDGKYIDADYNIGKIKVKLSTSKSVTIDNTNDDNEYVKAAVSDTKVIGQDSDNIYRLAKITLKSVKDDSKISSINGLTINEDTTAFTIADGGKTVSFNVIQVLSKAQSSGNADGIKYSKTVSNYVISDKNGKKEELLNDDENGFTLSHGNLINYKVNSDSVEAQVVDLKTKSSYGYIDQKSSDSQKVSNGSYSVDIDAEGNIWTVTDEYIRKFDNSGDFEKVYTLSEECKNISVYDKDNIVAWNESEEKFFLIGSKNIGNTSVDILDNNNNQNNTNTNTNTNNNNNTNNNIPGNTVQKSGWQQLPNGNWNYINSNGLKATGWLSDGTTWYYLNADGVMQTGWLNNGGTWYYLQSSGAMQTGWLNDGGTWYYLQSSGAMQIGWLNDGGTWYYLNSNGKMAVNTTIDGYKLGSNGAWIR